VRPLATLLAVALLAAPLARAEDAGPAAPVTTATETRGRGWLTGFGVGLLGLGLAGVMLGIGGVITMSEANTLLAAYYPTPGSAPTAAEAPAVKLIEARRDGASAMGVAAFITGGVALATGILFLALDGRAPAVAVAPIPGGAAVAVAGRW